MGEYWEQEIQNKFGLNVYLRMTPADFPKTADVQPISGFKQFTNGFKSTENGRYTSMSTTEVLGNICKFISLDSAQNATLGPENRGSMEPEIEGFKGEESFLVPLAKTSEGVSAFCYANARSLAKLAAMMANKGSLGEEKLMEQATWDEMHSDPDFKRCVSVGYGMIFTKGGFCRFDLDEL